MIVREQTTVISDFAHMLLHGDGADAATTLTDTAGRHTSSIIAAGVELDTAQSKFGGASILIPSNTADTRMGGNTSDFTFGTGDFTIDFWIRYAAIIDGSVAFVMGGGSFAQTKVYLMGTGGIISVSESGILCQSASGVISANAWLHVAWTRASGVTRLFVNGTQVATDPGPAGNYDFTTLDITNQYATGNSAVWLDELRVIKGEAKWTANFTSPAAPYPAASSTVVPFTDSGLPVIGSNNIVTLGNIEATTEDLDFPASNLANPSTHLKWQEPVTSPQSTADVYITVAVPLDTTVSPAVQSTIDYLAIAKHNFGSAGCTVSIESTTDATSPIGGFTEIASTTPTNDDPIIFQFEARQATFIRLKITDGSALRQLAVLYVGELLTMERGVKADATHTPINLGRITNVINGFSESGNFLGRILRNNVNESKAEFMHFTPVWYRANFDPFLLQARTHPFFWAWDPADYPTDVGFAWLMKDAIPEFNPVTLRFNITLEMRGLA